jgi:short-subunit dehydrogenase
LTQGRLIMRGQSDRPARRWQARRLTAQSKRGYGALVGDAAAKVTVITGASSGIGEAAARLFAARGDDVVLVARRRDRLAALRDQLSDEGRRASVVSADLAVASEVEALFPALLESHGRVDVLINNAGYGKQARFEHMTTGQVAHMLAVNVQAPMTLSRHAAAHMVERGSGSIVNVASVGGLVAHPLNVAYCASKHALVGFSKALRLELWGTGVMVTAVCPAATQTEFFDVARSDIPFDRLIAATAVPAERVARVIVKASTRNRAVVFPTWGGWFLYWADKWLPWLSAAGNIRYRDKVLTMAERGEE